MIWGYLIHLGYNMWLDREAPELDKPDLSAKSYLRFDEELWDELLPAMSAAGVNTLVIDLGEGVRYASHPEIAVDGSWSVEKLQAEVERLRSMGIEPIPKLNFSATHDAWLGPYSRMVSTSTYYEVCRDLIGEVIEIFDGPPLFHLGMDEETAEHQRHHAYAVMRQY
ncbi:MAG: Tat pathway signal protein, partial [Armatimonadota bacterium]